MKRKQHNLPAEDDAEATLVEPRFNEAAEEAARPVVPLSQVTSADVYGRVPAGGPYVTARYGRSGVPRGLAIMLAIVAVAAIVTAAALYRSARPTAPAAAPQTVNGTTVETEPETVESAPKPAAVERASQPATEPSSPARENGTTASARPARESEVRTEVSAREEPENRVRKDDERRARDEDKSIERARKEEKKQARREEKDAGRLAGQQRDAEKRGEVRPRLVGIYTERRKP